MLCWIVGGKHTATFTTGFVDGEFGLRIFHGSCRIKVEDLSL